MVPQSFSASFLFGIRSQCGPLHLPSLFPLLRAHCTFFRLLLYNSMSLEKLLRRHELELEGCLASLVKSGFTRGPLLD